MWPRIEPNTHGHSTAGGPGGPNPAVMQRLGFGAADWLQQGSSSSNASSPCEEGAGLAEPGNENKMATKNSIVAQADQFIPRRANPPSTRTMGPQSPMKLVTRAATPGSSRPATPRGSLLVPSTHLSGSELSDAITDVDHDGHAQQLTQPGKAQVFLERNGHIEAVDKGRLVHSSSTPEMIRRPPKERFDGMLPKLGGGQRGAPTEPTTSSSAPLRWRWSKLSQVVAGSAAWKPTTVDSGRLRHSSSTPEMIRRPPQESFDGASPEPGGGQRGAPAEPTTSSTASPLLRWRKASQAVVGSAAWKPTTEEHWARKSFGDVAKRVSSLPLVKVRRDRGASRTYGALIAEGTRLYAKKYAAGKNQYEGVEIIYRDAVALQPDHAAAHFALAVTYTAWQRRDSPHSPHPAPPLSYLCPAAAPGPISASSRPARR